MLLYVKVGIDYSEITELASEQVESVWIKLMYKKKDVNAWRRIIIIIIRQPLRPVVGRRPQHVVSK